MSMIPAANATEDFGEMEEELTLDGGQSVKIFTGTRKAVVTDQ